MHGESTNTGRCTPKENLEGLALSDYSPLGKTSPDMAQKFVQCLEELSICESELKELEGIIQKCNNNISYLKNKLQEFIRIMFNLLENPLIAGKIFNERLVILNLRAII